MEEKERREREGYIQEAEVKEEKWERKGYGGRRSRRRGHNAEEKGGGGRGRRNRRKWGVRYG